MGSSFEADFDELLDSLPEPTRLEGSTTSKRGASCFVGISGFEPRCRTAAQKLAGLSWKTDSALCVHYVDEEMRAANEEFTPDLYRAMRQMTNGNEPFPVEHEEHNLGVDFGTRLVGMLESRGLDLDSPDVRITFDITAGSSRLLLEGLNALLSCGVSLTLAYSEAEEYRPTFAEYREYLDGRETSKIPPPEFLTLGVEQVEVLKRLPGRNADARPTYLVVFPSFTPTRIAAVVEELAPSRVHWLFGIPHLVKNRWRLDAQRDYHEFWVERSHRHCYVSTFDYRETLAVLESIYRQRKNDYSLLVCSLGSKFQKLGQSLFHILRPEVGAVVSVPTKWDPERFSSQTVRAVYLLDLGDCRKLRDLLWRTRTFRV